MLEVSSVQRKKMTEPDALGFFGEYGGRYVPEPLVGACQEVEAAFRDATTQNRDAPEIESSGSQKFEARALRTV